MLTIPASLWTELLSSTLRPLLLYELQLANVTAAKASEAFANASLDAWASATDCTDWSETLVGSSTINQETSEVHTFGGASMRADLVDVGGGNLCILSQNPTLSPGHWYCISMWHKASASVASAWRVMVKNNTQSRWLKSDGTWDASAQYLTRDAETAWTLSRFWFQVDASFDLADSYTVRVFEGLAAGNGESIYVDDASLEGPFDQQTLYYSSQDVTWGDIAYSKLAVSQRDLRFEMDKGPEVTVAFSNVNNTLRSYLEPTDYLTGGEMLIRFVARDSSWAVLPEGLVLFRGMMETPKRIEEDELEIRVGDVLNVDGLTLPHRRTALFCPWLFANGDLYDGAGQCAYQQTTLANGAGASSTALTVDDGTYLVDGRDIIIGDGDAVAISSGGGTTSITLAEARSWSDNDPVKYADCNREITDCTNRQMTHRFGGFAAVTSVSRALWVSERKKPEVI